MDTFLTDYLDRLEELHQEISQSIAGLPVAALDWTPGAEMNSINVLVAHIAGAERYLIGEVAGGLPSGRDRDAEFRTSGLDERHLKKILANATAYAREILNRITFDDLAKTGISPRDGRRINVGWALLHALKHTANHLGHIQIVRQLWDQKTESGNTNVEGG